MFGIEARREVASPEGSDIIFSWFAPSASPMLRRRSRRHAADEVWPSVNGPRISVSDFSEDKLRLVDGRPRFLALQ